MFKYLYRYRDAILLPKILKKRINGRKGKSREVCRNECFSRLCPIVYLAFKPFKDVVRA